MGADPDSLVIDIKATSVPEPASLVFLAEDMAARLRRPGLTMMERRQVSGSADELMCTSSLATRAWPQVGWSIASSTTAFSMAGSTRFFSSGLRRLIGSVLGPCIPRSPANAGRAVRADPHHPDPAGPHSLV